MGAAGGQESQIQSDTPEARKFFGSLSDDAFSDEECALRDVLMRFLDEWTKDAPPRVSEACDRRQPIGVEVDDAQKALIPPKVDVAEWIARRMGGEVELHIEGPREVYFHHIGKLDVGLVKNNK